MALPAIRIEGLWKKYHKGEYNGVSILNHARRRLPFFLFASKPLTVTPEMDTPKNSVTGNDCAKLFNRKDVFWALQDLSIDIPQGQSVGVIGRNGAGKSTLLKILSRITSPTYGKIFNKGKISSLLEVGTGFHPDLSGRENIYLNGTILGMRRFDITSKLDEIVEFSGVNDFIDTPVKRYSSGMYVRLAFAVAAHLNSDILLVDEVLSVGDVDFQRKCLGKMDDVVQQGKTVLFVSHNLPAVLNLCDKSIILDEGELVMFGKTDRIIDYYLKRDQSNKHEWIALEQPDFNKVLKIRRIILKNQLGELTNQFSREDKCNLEIEVEVFKPGRGYNVSYELSNLGQGVIFTSSFWDGFVKERQDYYWPGGIMVVSVVIPVQILREGDYFLKVAATVPKIEILDIFKDEPFFRVLDRTSPIVQTGEGRKGIIMPIVGWDII